MTPRTLLAGLGDERKGCGPLIAPLSETTRPLRQQVFDRVRAAGLIPRVQVAKGRAYRPDEKDQRELRRLLRTLHEGEPLEGSVCLGAAFYLPDLRTRDTDNMLKHLGDSANGILWKDDRQVTAMAGYVELDRERPRTVVLYGADELTTVRR